MKRLVLFFLTCSFLLATTIEVTYEDEKQIIINGLKQVVIVDGATNISVLKKTNMLIIKGIMPGESSILAITSAGSIAYKVRVNPKLIFSVPKSQIDYSGKKFYSNLNIGYGGGNSNSDYSQNVWDYHYMYYKLNTTGETPWGLFNNSISFKNRQDYQGLNYFSTSLKNTSGTYTYGDQMYNDSSQMVFPSQPLQGFSYAGNFNRFDLFAFYGNNNYGMWGSTLEREQRNTQTFYFAKIAYLLDKLSSTGINLSTYATSVYYKTSFSKFNLMGEYAIDKNNKSAKDILVGYNSNVDIIGKLNYKEYEDGYSLPVGMVDYRGFKGFNYELSYLPKDYFSATYSGNTYKRSLNSQELTNRKNNIQLALYGEKYRKFLPDFFVSYWDIRDESPVSTYSITTVVTSSVYTPFITPSYTVTTTNYFNNYQYSQQGLSFKMRKTIPLLVNTDIWYIYSPVKYESFNNINSNYNKTSSVFGGRIPVVNMFSLQTEFTFDNYQTSSINYNENIIRNFFQLNPIAVYQQSVFFNAFYQYDFRYNDNLKETFRKHFYKAEFVYYPNADGSLLFAFYRTVDDTPQIYKMSRILDETRIEYSQNFNFMVNFDRGKSQITGKVYIDENMNARNEDSEEGVAGVVLTLSDGRTTTSNKYGIYKFEGLLPGSYSMELKSPDNSVELIDESAKNIDMQANQRRMLNFAVARSQKISGYVYMDENGNGQKDDLELVFPDVRISAGEDNATKTDREGYYEFSGTMLNRNAVLQIDITTLPEGFRLAGDRKTKADKNGEYNFTVIKSQLINLDKEDKKLLQEEKKDDFIQIISIKPLAKGQTLFSAKLMKDIDAVYVNDKAVKIKDSYFQATVPNNIKQAKIKFFDKNKKFWVKYYKY